MSTTIDPKLQKRESAKDQVSGHPLFVNNREYLAALRDIGQTVQIVLPHTTDWLQDEIKSRGKKIEKLLQQNQQTGDKGNLLFKSAREYAEFMTAIKEFGDLQNHRGLDVLKRSLFMQMFSEFDTFMGGLLRAVYQKNDSLYKGIKRELSFSEVIEFSDIESIKVATLNKEIDAFRRDSYVEQFSSLEAIFGLPLKKFDEWGRFVELSQRRNILTHNGGVVNDQYLIVCKKEGVKFEVTPKIGQVLEIDVDYFNNALRLMSKVGFMLTHTLWKKIFQNESDLIHVSMNNTIYGLLEQKRWQMARELGEFALTDLMRKDIVDIDMRIRVINVSIACKFSNEMGLASQLLDGYDWSASYRDFKLAKAVLKDDFEEVINLMKSIGHAGEIIRQADYHQWPLFFEFRKHPEFFMAYEEIYKEPFSESISGNEVGDKQITVEVAKEAAPKKAPARKMAVEKKAKKASARKMAVEKKAEKVPARKISRS